MNAIFQVEEAVARMERHQDSALEKLHPKLNLEVARRFGPPARDTPAKVESTRSATDVARTRREAETREAARLEAARLERERTDALLARYRIQTEAHQAEEAQRVTAMMEFLQREIEDMRAGGPRSERNLDEFLAAQLRATLSAAAPDAPARGSADARPERKAQAEDVPQRKAQVGSARGRSVRVASRQSEGGGTPRPAERNRGYSKHRGDPDSSDSGSSSDRSSSNSDSSDSSSFEDVAQNAPTVAGPGGTLFTFRPYVNAKSLEDFDEKASLAGRSRWLERFPSIAAQGEWTDNVKIYEMKLKLSAAVRNWRANLRPKRDQVPAPGGARKVKWSRYECSTVKLS
ncbi:uncharacterized protein IUM83_15173 [Phytophthora cinnamomi]|uniref:uncharacterized protein n=1 Tax=Phytophthora cinnamomi TaxID=4785 RepID=UPI0035599929|nr:hypothetical protein IUM83_15173 [Phytophthora cinnamomi]